LCAALIHSFIHLTTLTEATAASKTWKCRTEMRKKGKNKENDKSSNIIKSLCSSNSSSSSYLTKKNRQIMQRECEKL